MCNAGSSPARHLSINSSALAECLLVRVYACESSDLIVNVVLPSKCAVLAGCTGA